MWEIPDTLTERFRGNFSLEISGIYNQMQSIQSNKQCLFAGQNQTKPGPKKD